MTDKINYTVNHSLKTEYMRTATKSNILLFSKRAVETKETSVPYLEILQAAYLSLRVLTSQSPVNHLERHFPASLKHVQNQNLRPRNTFLWDPNYIDVHS